MSTTAESDEINETVDGGLRTAALAAARAVEVAGRWNERRARDRTAAAYTGAADSSAALAVRRAAAATAPEAERGRGGGAEPDDDAQQRAEGRADRAEANRLLAEADLLERAEQAAGADAARDGAARLDSSAAQHDTAAQHETAAGQQLPADEAGRAVRLAGVGQAQPAAAATRPGASGRGAGAVPRRSAGPSRAPVLTR